MLEGKLIISDGEDDGQIDSDFEGNPSRDSLTKNLNEETSIKAGYLKKKGEHRRVIESNFRVGKRDGLYCVLD